MGALKEALLDRLVKPSTREFWKQSMRVHGKGAFQESLHGWFYMSWPRLYISLGLGRSRATRALREPASWLAHLFGLWTENGAVRFADTYHGKVMPPEHMRRLIQVNRPVEMSVPETVLPYAAARDIILENPDDLVLFDCPCRGTVADPCLPLDVCIIVGQPFSSFVLEHHPGKSRKIDSRKALEVVRESHQRGHVSHAFFKEAMLGRYYAICNCCSCCCGAMQAQRHGIPMIASSGFVAAIDEQACLGCGKCLKNCQFSALSMIGRPGRDRRLAVVDGKDCYGCGVCTVHCPSQAISLQRDPSKPAPLDV